MPSWSPMQPGVGHLFPPIAAPWIAVCSIPHNTTSTCSRGGRAALALDTAFRLVSVPSPDPRPVPGVNSTRPLCDILSGCCSFTGPWTVTRSSLRMLRWVAAFCRPLRPVLLLVLFPRSRSPVVGLLSLGVCSWAAANCQCGKPPLHTSCCATWSSRGCHAPLRLPLPAPTSRFGVLPFGEGGEYSIARLAYMVLNVAWCAVCASAAPNSWRIEDVLVVAGVV